MYYYRGAMVNWESIHQLYSTPKIGKEWHKLVAFQEKCR